MIAGDQRQGSVLCSLNISSIRLAPGKSGGGTSAVYLFPKQQAIGVSRFAVPFPCLSGKMALQYLSGDAMSVRER